MQLLRVWKMAVEISFLRRIILPIDGGGEERAIRGFGDEEDGHGYCGAG